MPGFYGPEGTYDGCILVEELICSSLYPHKVILDICEGGILFYRPAGRGCNIFLCRALYKHATSISPAFRAAMVLGVWLLDRLLWLGHKQSWPTLSLYSTTGSLLCSMSSARKSLPNARFGNYLILGAMLPCLPSVEYQVLAMFTLDTKRALHEGHRNFRKRQHTFSRYH